MKQLTELRDKMLRKNYLENAKILDAAIERIGELEEDRDEFKEMLANIMECSTKDCVCGGNMNITCGHGGCQSTADYYAIPNAKELLAKRDLEQQAKGVELVLDLQSYSCMNESAIMMNESAIMAMDIHGLSVSLRQKAQELKSG